MLKTICHDTSVTVVVMKNLNTKLCVFLTLVVNIATRKRMRIALMIGVICYATQVAALLVTSRFQSHAFVEKSPREFHVRSHKGPNSSAKMNAVNS
jgi:hypothetical protein